MPSQLTRILLPAVVGFFFPLAPLAPSATTGVLNKSAINRLHAEAQQNKPTTNSLQSQIK